MGVTRRVYRDAVVASVGFWLGIGLEYLHHHTLHAPAWGEIRTGRFHR